MVPFLLVESSIRFSSSVWQVKYVATKMAERQVGAIINIASMAGKIATPKSTVYSATKFAVLGYHLSGLLDVQFFHLI